MEAAASKWVWCTCVCVCVCVCVWVRARARVRALAPGDFSLVKLCFARYCLVIFFPTLLFALLHRTAYVSVSAFLPVHCCLEGFPPPFPSTLLFFRVRPFKLTTDAQSSITHNAKGYLMTVQICTENDIGYKKTKKRM